MRREDGRNEHKYSVVLCRICILPSNLRASLKEKVCEMIEEVVKKITDKKWKEQNTFQKKIGKAAVCFFLIFFFCGLISRGMYGALLPRVSVGYPDDMYLSHNISVDGEIVENKKAAILTEEGIRIASVFVKNGQSVAQGEPLIQLDLDDLKDLMESKKIEIKKHEIQIQAMEKNEALTQKEKEISEQRAREDYDLTKKKGDAAVAEAQNQVKDAKEERDALPSKKDYVAAGKEKDAKYQSLQKDLEDKKASLKELKTKETSSLEENRQIEAEREKLQKEIEEAKTELSAYEEELTETLKGEWETRKQQLAESVESLEEQTRQATEQRDSDMLTAARVLEDAARETSVDSSLELAKLEKEQLEKQLAAYEKIKEAGGKILAPMEGDIVEIHAVEGDRTGDGALLHMTDTEQGYRFTGEMTKAERKRIQIGDKVKLTVGSDEETFSDIAIEAIEEDEEREDVYHVSFPVTKEMGKLGDIGTMKMTTQGEEKQLCVPLEAIHSDGNKNYLLLAVANQTILGEELKVIKKNVMILDKNDNYAAIEAGVVNREEQIIISSTKQIKEGDTVRLSEQ